MKLINFTIILLVGIYIYILALTNKLGFYIHPRYFAFTEAGGYVAIFVGLCGIIYIIKEKKIREDFKINKFVSYSIIILFLSMAFFLPTKQLSSRVVSKRVDSNAKFTLKSDEVGTLDKWLKSDETLTIAEWIQEFTRNTDKESFVGRKVSLEGSVILNDYLDQDNEFLLTRLFIRCCIVDATPIGIRVKKQNWRNEFELDQWLSLKGEFKYDGTDIYIEPSEIKLIDIPDNPYAY